MWLSHSMYLIKRVRRSVVFCSHRGKFLLIRFWRLLVWQVWRSQRFRRLLLSSPYHLYPSGICRGRSLPSSGSENRNEELPLIVQLSGNDQYHVAQSCFPTYQRGRNQPKNASQILWIKGLDSYGVVFLLRYRMRCTLKWPLSKPIASIWLCTSWDLKSPWMKCVSPGIDFIGRRSTEQSKPNFFGATDAAVEVRWCATFTDGTKSAGWKSRNSAHATDQPPGADPKSTT